MPSQFLSQVSDQNSSACAYDSDLGPQITKYLAYLYCLSLRQLMDEITGYSPSFEFEENKRQPFECKHRFRSLALRAASIYFFSHPSAVLARDYRWLASHTSTLLNPIQLVI